MSKAVVLFSGGMDSATVLSMAVQEHGFGNVIAVSGNYGQKHAVELHAAASIASFLGLHDHIVVDLPNVFRGGGRSALMGEIPMPHISYQEIAETPGESPTVVPFRNGVLLSVAAAIAEVHKADWIWAGMHGEDARNWAYPDCTPEFLGAMANAIRVGTYDRVRFKFPFAFMMKSEVCRIGLELHTPYDLTWSCYDPTRIKSRNANIDRWVACGKCPTCIERIHAFKANHAIDPIEYATVIDWTS